ncbi:MAG: metallophosphoesterase [Mobilicoccus sp.]|nr:metallophosphoesterase [Mobilicoccus sp.]
MDTTERPVARLSRRSMLGLTAGAAATVALSSRTSYAHGGQISLLTEPFLQLPERDRVRVVWFTEQRGTSHHVVLGRGVHALDAAQGRLALSGRSRRRDQRGLAIVAARTTQLSRTREDAQSYLPESRRPSEGIRRRPIWRHEAVVTGLRPGSRTPYRVLSVDGRAAAISGAYTLGPSLRRGDDAVIMLTSDHQAMINTPANMTYAKATIERELGPIAAVFFAGDLVNIPDRASEWFDDDRGSAFFPVLQGTAGRKGTDDVLYRGADIIQHAPLYPAIGNHEVQGRIDGHTQLGASFNNPIPVEVATREYAKVASRVNPSGDAAVKAQWIEDNSFSSRTYEEIFTLPGNEQYYATTVGDVRLVVLYSTRIWRGTDAVPDPAARTTRSRYQEAKDALEKPLEQGYGEFIFEDIGVGSAQYRWLQAETRSPEFRRARYRIVMLHEGPHGLGDNVMPQFVHPVRVEEKDDTGRLIGIRYDYPSAGNVALHDLAPLLERAKVNLVYNGHSHLWNRFTAPGGTHYLEASNTGNSYGAFHPLSGRSRPVPPAPWNTGDYLAQGNPGGLDPIVPTIAPLRTDAGEPTPFIADNRYVVFQALHTGTGEITSWYVDMQHTAAGAIRFDRFRL